MNAWRAAWTVFRKELVDALRDRRTLVVVLLSSVVMGPVVMAMISGLIDKMQRQAEAREIVVVGIEHAPSLGNFLARQTWVVRAAPADWPAQLRESRLGDPVLVVPTDFEASLAHGVAPRLELLTSSSNGRAQSALGRIERILQGFNQEQASLRLIARGVAPAVLQVVEVDTHDLAGNAARSAQITGMLPFFVLMAVVYGALNASLDITAGERERGSLEPLLATPIGRPALVTGKWGAVFCVALLIAVLSCLSFLPGQWLIRNASVAALFHFGLREALAFILLLAPLAAALSALMMAIAIRCRTVKEAQASNAVVVLAVSMLPLLTLLGQEGESRWQFWAPAVAQTTLMNRVLKSMPIGVGDVLPSSVVCLAIAALSLWYVSRNLNRSATR
ncbi:MAG TPA: ABC transporter permease subunit [Burkholderiaceae bacterium]|nr:ABC transporter permease subunit [Burkholderiaceae bacterium]